MICNRVMLIDDDRVDNLINQRAISKKGMAHEFNIMDDGNMALEYLRAHESDNNRLPDLIFLDINMPVMNGFEFLEAFEQLPTHIKDHTKIVMLSSSLDHRDMERARSNRHVIKYITKPLTIERLDELNTDL